MLGLFIGAAVAKRAGDLGKNIYGSSKRIGKNINNYYKKKAAASNTPSVQKPKKPNTTKDKLANMGFKPGK